VVAFICRIWNWGFTLLWLRWQPTTTHYTASLSKRPQSKFSPPWSPHSHKYGLNNFIQRVGAFYESGDHSFRVKGTLWPSAQLNDVVPLLLVISVPHVQKFLRELRNWPKKKEEENQGEKWEKTRSTHWIWEPDSRSLHFYGKTSSRITYLLFHNTCQLILQNFDLSSIFNCSTFNDAVSSLD
jgi:hypothetical protein